MASFEIRGNKPLNGELEIQGAKNEALQVICAVLLTSEKVTIHNIPDILDVNRLIDILCELGVEVERHNRHSCSFRAHNVNIETLKSKLYQEKAASIRGSVMTVGALLARFGKAYLPQPGGDKIGRRRLDTHFNGLMQLGASFSFDPEEKIYQVHTQRLKGSYILLDEASVTGTANIVMAATLAQGNTTIFNAACEPYVAQLCQMLNLMGAKISGIGSNLLTINGVQTLSGCQHTIMPDMIEIGSFIGLAAMTRSNITIRNVDIKALGLIPTVFQRLGINIEVQANNMHIPAQEHYEVETFIDGSILTIADAPWPGFTPDLISIALVTAIQAKGTVLIHQKMFESRLFFVDKLIDMGAQIILCDPHRATVIGMDRKFHLRGVRMASPDIRAGVALLIAALSANGKSTIDNIDQIDRGYDRIDERLQSIGADIIRIG